MQVTALNEEEVMQACKLDADGVMLTDISRQMGKTRKTLRRAMKLYREQGDSIFKPEKIPQRGNRPGRIFKPIPDKYNFLYRRW